MLLADIPQPTFIETLDSEAIVARKTASVQTILASKGIVWIPSESDDLLTMIEADAYDEVLLRSAINDRIAQQYITYATGSNLDAVATKYYDTRLQGSKPTANFTFTLTEIKPFDVIIPAGMILGDGGILTATLLNSITVYAGASTADGIVELDSYVSDSDVQTTNIYTPVPHLLSVTQNSSYTGGVNAEDDDTFRERVWTGREKKTTAGSKNMYKYYTMLADARIKDIYIASPTLTGEVDIVIAFDRAIADSIAINRVYAALNADDVRPVSDRPTVRSVVITDVTVTATVTLASLLDQGDVNTFLNTQVQNNSCIFGKSLPMSKLYALFADSRIKDVSIASPLSGIALDSDEMANIILDVTYV